ncbi:MAG: SprT-like domain-containing protein [Phycisphaerales bacterium]|nr:SprT-like domain-containing protein [Phycisphaerales bacterium]
MEFGVAERMGRELIAGHGLREWRFGWNRRKRALGLCRYREKRIELSLYFVRDNDERMVRETILHEVAHALAGEKAGHGVKWRAMCAKVGCKAERCDKGAAVMPYGRWRGRCVGCGKEYWRHRRPMRGAKYWCRTCGSEKGKVQFFMQVVEVRGNSKSENGGGRNSKQAQNSNVQNEPAQKIQKAQKAQRLAQGSFGF